MDAKLIMIPSFIVLMLVPQVTWETKPPIPQARSAAWFRLLACGMQPALVDGLVLDAFLDENKKTGSKSDFFYKVMLLAELDPRFLAVYDAGSVILSIALQDDAGSQTLLAKGTTYADTAEAKHLLLWQNEGWRLDIMRLWHALFHDVLEAIPILDHTVRLYPGAPPYMAQLAKKLSTKQGTLETKLRVITMLLNRKHNHEVHQALIRQKKEIQEELQYVRDSKIYNVPY